MEQTITCINCPMGCRMSVRLSQSGEVLSVTGNTCPRGERYAVQECTMPVRMITAVIPVSGSSVPLSVKTSQPVPKSMIKNIMKEMARITVSLPVHTGQVIVSGILDTDADIVATRSIEKS